MTRLLCAVMLVLGGVATAAAQEQDFFPLRKGTYWIYRGYVRWTEAGTNRIREKTLTWRMEVVETIARGKIAAAVITGHPADLNSYEEKQEPSRRVLLVVEGRRFFLSEGDEADDLVQQLRDNKQKLEELPSDDDLILELPLHAGQFIGPQESLARQDAMYKWSVESERKDTLNGIEGVAPSVARASYQLIYRTNPDHMIVTYVQGVGIGSYEYGHHGTTAEVNVRLAEFHPAPGNAAK